MEPDTQRAWLDGLAPGPLRHLFDHLPGTLFFGKRPTAPQAAHGSRARDRQVADMRRIDVGPRPAGRGALAAWYAEALDVQRASGLSVAEFAPRVVLAAIHDPAAIARVLGALGLTAADADPAGCRAPPAAAGLDDADEGNAAE